MVKCKILLERCYGDAADGGRDCTFVCYNLSDCYMGMRNL